MVVVTQERLIPAAPRRIWEVVSDLHRLPQWYAFADHARLLEGGPGVGRRQRLSGRWGKHLYEVDQRVVEFVPNRLLVWEHEAERLDGRPAPRFSASTRFSIILDAVGDSTVTRLVSQQQPAGRLKGLIMHLGSRRIARSLRASLRDLERILVGG